MKHGFNELMKFFMELIKMIVTLPIVFLSIFEDRDPLADDLESGYVLEG